MAYPNQSRLQGQLPMPGTVIPKLRKRFFSVMEMNGWAAALVGSGAGDPIIGEQTTSSLTGLRIQADADSFAGVISLPYDVDINADIRFRIFWSSDQTTVADEYTWTMTYAELTLNSTSNMDTAAATALDTALVADANLVTANALQATAWGVIAAGTLSGTEQEDYLLNVLLTATTNGGTVATDLVVWYGLQMEYMPRQV